VTAAWALLALIAAGLIAAIVAVAWLEGSDRITGGPDAAWLKEIGTETAAEEVPVRRLRISDLWRQRAARIGRRPRP